MIFKFVTKIVLILMNKLYIGYIHPVDYIKLIDVVLCTIHTHVYCINIGLVEY